MQAMTVTEFGEQDVLKLQDVPAPQVKPTDLLIEVHAAGVNPVDYKVRMGKLPIEREFPFVLGYDAAGVVKQVGAEAKGFAVGDEVYCSPSLARNGSNAELVAADYRTVAPKPKSLSFVEAAAVPLVLITAWEALYDRCGLPAPAPGNAPGSAPNNVSGKDTATKDGSGASSGGRGVLIQGGGGGVGHVAIQLAKLAGSAVYATAHSDASRQLAQRAGADEVIDYKQTDVVDRVHELTDGNGVGVAFDTVGGDSMNQCLQAVGLCGQVAGIVGVPESDHRVNELYRKSATLHLEFMGVPPLFGINIDHHGEVLRAAADLIDDGKLFVAVHDTFPLAQLPDAHQQQETGHTPGKLVVTVR